MEPVGVIIVIAVAAGAVFWWNRRRAASAPVEDEWQLPPEHGESVPASPPEPQILDREAVLGRSRVFDPSNWDNSPEGASAAPAEEPEPGDLPKFFDRDYLDRKKPHGETPS